MRKEYDFSSMEKPERRECKCQRLTKCQCEGYNEAWDLWNDWLDSLEAKEDRESHRETSGEY